MNIRTLKKIINEKISFLIEDVYVWQLMNDDKMEKGEEIIDKAIDLFDELIEKVNAGKKAENKKEYFRGIHRSLDEQLGKLKAMME